MPCFHLGWITTQWPTYILIKTFLIRMLIIFQLSQYMSIQKQQWRIYPQFTTLYYAVGTFDFSCVATCYSVYVTVVIHPIFEYIEQSDLLHQYMMRNLILWIMQALGTQNSISFFSDAGEPIIFDLIQLCEPMMWGKRKENIFSLLTGNDKDLSSIKPD